LQNQSLELFLKDQQCCGLRQRSVSATHLKLQLIMPALQLAQCGARQALLGRVCNGRLWGGAEGIAPLDQLVLEQAFLAAPGVQRRPLQGVAFVQSQQPLNKGVHWRAGTSPGRLAACGKPAPVGPDLLSQPLSVPKDMFSSAATDCRVRESRSRALLSACSMNSGEC